MAEAEAALTPEERAGRALTVEQIVRLVPCPRPGCNAPIGAGCRTPNPILNRLHAEPGLAFAHAERIREAGAMVLEEVAA